MLLALFCPPPTAPPFAVKPVAPFATVNDCVRLWLALLPLTIVGPPTEGTAGMVGFLPFTGDIASAEGGPPTAVDMFEGSDAFDGGAPLVAEAYEERPEIEAGAGADDEGADELGEVRACAADRRALVVSVWPWMLVC